jgi:hypothetical protein
MSVNSPRNVRGQVEVTKTSSKSDNKCTHLLDLQDGVVFTNFPLTYFIIAANGISPPVCDMLYYTLGAQLFLQPPHATPHRACFVSLIETFVDLSASLTENDGNRGVTHSFTHSPTHPFIQGQ